jgi:hypothetical protein
LEAVVTKVFLKASGLIAVVGLFGALPVFGDQGGTILLTRYYVKENASIEPWDPAPQFKVGATERVGVVFDEGPSVRLPDDSRSVRIYTPQNLFFDKSSGKVRLNSVVCATDDGNPTVTSVKNRFRIPRTLKNSGKCVVAYRDREEFVDDGYQATRFIVREFYLQAE